MLAVQRDELNVFDCWHDIANIKKHSIKIIIHKLGCLSKATLKRPRLVQIV